MLSKAIPINKVTCGSQNLTDPHFHLAAASLSSQSTTMSKATHVFSASTLLYVPFACTYNCRMQQGLGCHPEDWYRVCLPAAESGDLKNTVPPPHPHTHTHCSRTIY